MDKFIVQGGFPLVGDVIIGGAKNVALKAFVASLLTDEEIIIHNIPLIRDVYYMLEILENLGVHVALVDHTAKIRNGHLKHHSVPLEVGARLRTSSMVLGPLLARYGQANIPNPGGCRIGARPIDRHIDGLKKMGATISYNSSDGYFHAKATRLHGTDYSFPKNTHTGTESVILAAVTAEGRTVLDNAAEEVEVDDLIELLNRMGSQIKRVAPRRIVIDGVSKLHGVEYTIMADRNEEVTFAVAAALTNGNIVIRNSQLKHLGAFLELYTKAGSTYESLDEHVTRYRAGNTLHATDIITGPHPKFMTDWQAPWSVLMTQAHGKSTIHETVFESRFSYVHELGKMGAKIDFYDPEVKNPKKFYNFNWSDRIEGYHQGIIISGPTTLHNAILEIDDLRAGATLVLAALIAPGESYIHGVEQIDRGYEKIEERLQGMGAHIKRVKDNNI